MGITKENFREVYEKYKNLVLRQVYDMTQDYYLAQDICQETFAKLYHYMDRVDEYGVKRCCVRKGRDSVAVMRSIPACE